MGWRRRKPVNEASETAWMHMHEPEELPFGPGLGSPILEQLQVQEDMQQIPGPLVTAQCFLPGPE